MANIIITSDANFLYIAYNDVTNYAAARKIKKAHWAETTCLSNTDGVELNVVGDNGINLVPSEVDSVDGNTTITTDSELYNALILLM